MYQIYTHELLNNLCDVDPRFQGYVSNSATQGLLKHRRARFEESRQALRARDIAYDPRNAEARVPRGEAGRLARDAKNTLEQLMEVEEQHRGWQVMLEEAAARQRARLEKELKIVRLAWSLHGKFIAQVWHHALRWRITGKTVLFSVRWVRKVFGARYGGGF